MEQINHPLFVFFFFHDKVHYMIIIILGAGIDRKRRISQETVKRLREAFSIYRKNKSPLLLCGKYNFPFDKKNPPKFTEAEVMRDYLISLGVDSENILPEEESTDTISSAYYAKTKVLIPGKEKKVVVVTSDVSLERVEYVFYKVLGEEYRIHVAGTLSKLSCGSKGMILAKQRMLTEKAKEILDGIKEGDHEAVREKVLGSDYERKIGSSISPTDYKKTC